MKQLLLKLIEEIKDGRSAVLCTIIGAHGSTPRGAGTRMAVYEDGTTLGTVGGGAVELLAIKRAQNLIESQQSVVEEFALNKEMANSTGMICGGQVSIYFQLLKKDSLPFLEEFYHATITNENSWLQMVIDGNCGINAEIIYESSSDFDPIKHNNNTTLIHKDSIEYVEPIVKKGMVYIFGGGHVGGALVPVLSTLGFRVTVFDDRKDYADFEHFPQADFVIYGNYNNILEKISVDKSDYVVILTPGHQGDYEVLQQLVTTPLKYIGCIGSKKKVQITKERLRNQCIPEEYINRIHAPIGLTIGAQTPEEIAISIAAELIMARSNLIK